MSCGDSWNSSKFGKLSDFSTYIWTRDIYVMWRNLKFVYMWRNFRFFTSVMFWNLELRKSNYYIEPWLFFIRGRAGRRAPLRFCRENLFMRKLPAAELTLLLLSNIQHLSQDISWCWCWCVTWDAESALLMLMLLYCPTFNIHLLLLMLMIKIQFHLISMELYKIFQAFQF